MCVCVIVSCSGCTVSDYEMFETMLIKSVYIDLCLCTIRTGLCLCLRMCWCLSMCLRFCVYDHACACLCLCPCHTVSMLVTVYVCVCVCDCFFAFACQNVHNDII